MTGNPVHDLLDAVSAHGPTTVGPSVDDLVRAGRRRRRAIPAAAAGATVLVVAAASALLTPPGSRGTTATPTTGSPGPARSAAVAPAPRATAFLRPTVTSLQLVRGNQLVAFVRVRPGCTGPTTLTAVETSTTVRVSLTIPVIRPTGGCSSTTTSVSTTLKAALGKRWVADASTGRYVPVTRDTDQLVPAEVPGGFKSDGPVHPVTAQSWQQSFIPLAALTTSKATEVIVLTQRAADGAGIGGAANDLVGGSQARVVTTATTIGVTWQFGASLLTLTYRSVSRCNFAEVNNRPAPKDSGACRPVPAPTLMPRWQLLRMAALVNQPPNWRPAP